MHSVEAIGEIAFQFGYADDHVSEDRVHLSLLNSAELGCEYSTFLTSGFNSVGDTGRAIASNVQRTQAQNRREIFVMERSIKPVSGIYSLEKLPEEEPHAYPR